MLQLHMCAGCVQAHAPKIHSWCSATTGDKIRRKTRHPRTYLIITQCRSSGRGVAEIYIYIYTCICMYTHIHMHTRIHIHVQFTCLYIYIRTVSWCNMYIYTRVYIYVAHTAHVFPRALLFVFAWWKPDSEAQVVLPGWMAWPKMAQ